MAVLEAVDLYRFFHVGDEEIRALRGLSLALERGEFVAVMGPSGSGKSTLLNILAGLDEPDGGHVTIDGARLSRRPDGEKARLRARHIGILMQTGNLFDHLTIAENIQLQRDITGHPTVGVVRELADGLGIGARLDAMPSQLSGGEAARAGLAVALSSAPLILLADEPTAEVDAATQDVVVERLVAHAKAGNAVLVVTHSEAVARRADRIIDLRDGRTVSDAAHS